MINSISISLAMNFAFSTRYPWRIIKIYKNQCVHENNKKKNQGQDASLSTDSLECNFEKRWTFAYNTSFISLSFVAMAPSKVRWQSLYIFIL
jgi:hypothetical protein